MERGSRAKTGVVLQAHILFEKGIQIKCFAFPGLTVAWVCRKSTAKDIQGTGSELSRLVHSLAK